MGLDNNPVTGSKLRVSGRPEHRSASIPCALLNTTPPPASERTSPGSRSTRPVLRSRRVMITGLPTAEAMSDDGLSRSASRFFSRTPSARPVTIALAGSIPSATPSKRSRLSPAGRCTLRVSLISAKPSNRSRSIEPDTRAGARYTVTERSEGGSASTSIGAPAAAAPVAAAPNPHPRSTPIERSRRSPIPPMLIPSTATRMAPAHTGVRTACRSWR